MLPVVVVHGGAGHIPKERSEKSTEGVCSAVRAGYVVLKRGGSSMDAVVEAVTHLENNPIFNSGNVKTHSTVMALTLCSIMLRLTGDSKLSVGVNVSVLDCLSPSDRLVTCQGCTCLHPSSAGIDSSPMNEL
uniref:Uncharacterized protein n=1 Tax=Stegastes partitus TaxID=144197 RepID=A0A3B5BF11_9TELE